MKKLKASTVPSDQVKKIISVRDEFKQKFDAKSAETRQKESELADIRVKCDAAQKKVTELTEQNAKLTEKDKKNEEDAAKEKDKFRRLQQLAKGYRKQGRKQSKNNFINSFLQWPTKLKRSKRSNKKWRANWPSNRTRMSLVSFNYK